MIAVAGPAAKSVCYDGSGLGNVAYKSDVPTDGPTTGVYAASASTGTCSPGTANGTYSYPTPGNGVSRPHAVTSIAGVGSFTYDADGDMLTGNARTISWTSFGLVSSVTSGTSTVLYGYTPEHQRAYEAVTTFDRAVGSGCPSGDLLLGSSCYTPSLGTVFMAGYDAIGGTGSPSTLTCNNPGGGSYAVRNYITNPFSERVGEICRTGVTSTAGSGTPVASYYLNDWQNSVSVVATATGTVPGGYLVSYDAWGKMRNTNGVDSSTATSPVTRGYTNQEEVPMVGLINLNARMYDPVLGKMLSVDPAVANWLDPQAWNAYAYATNNPMAFTDPSGECWAFTNGCTVNQFFSDAWSDTKAVGSAVKSVLDTKLGPAAEVPNVFEASGNIPIFYPGTHTVQPTVGSVVGLVGLMAGGAGALGDVAEGTSVVSEVGGAGAATSSEGAAATTAATGGRLGSAATRAQNADIASKLESEGNQIIGGGGRLSEEYIPGSGPRTTGSTFVDITAVNKATGAVTRVQTIDTLASGLPTAREAAAAARIQAAFPNDTLILIPKQ